MGGVVVSKLSVTSGINERLVGGADMAVVVIGGETRGREETSPSSSGTIWPLYAVPKGSTSAPQ